MTCADFEIPICDYVDGALDAAGAAEVERHLAECPACAALARDSAAAVAFIERAADVEPPPQLMARILYDAPWNAGPAASGKPSWVAALLGPVWSPRIVMGCAMTVLCISMLTKFVGPLKPLKAGDLKPAAVWSQISTRADYAWIRAVKFVDDLKVVYQIQTTVQKWQQQDEDRPSADAESSTPKADDHKLPVKSAPGPGSTPPSAGGSK
ncbi:MAG TPA: zf-HC2 domain-containing protein [Bryobacteraceae bacterium]|nr:zf-HC2 domain-containing protein [Bryobacteraceae bacterium]